MNEWISVKERLPEDYIPVLVVYLGFYDRQPHSDLIAIRNRGKWCFYEGNPVNNNKEVSVPITHWMPLPELPRKEKE